MSDHHWRQPSKIQREGDQSSGKDIVFTVDVKVLHPQVMCVPPPMQAVGVAGHLHHPPRGGNVITTQGDVWVDHNSTIHWLGPPPSPLRNRTKDGEHQWKGNQGGGLPASPLQHGKAPKLATHQLCLALFGLCYFFHDIGLCYLC